MVVLDPTNQIFIHLVDTWISGLKSYHISMSALQAAIAWSFQSIDVIKQWVCFSVMFQCHVSANEEQSATLKKILGCF